MKQIIPYIVLIIFSQTIFAQKKLVNYKTKIDEVIAANFERGLLGKIKVVDLLISSQDSSNSRFIDYSLNKNKIIKFSSATFFLELFSHALNYHFRFSIAIDKKQIIIPDSTFLIDIPKCIVQNTVCNFISKDSALKIAINDSVLYPANLDVFLIKEHKKDIFYWLVTEKPKTKKIRETEGARIAGRQRRLINVITGSIISR